MRITITDTRCEWGAPVSEDEDRARHDVYVEKLGSEIECAFGSDVQYTIEIDRHSSGGSASVLVNGQRADDIGMGDVIRECMGRAWMAACEATP